MVLNMLSVHTAEEFQIVCMLIRCSCYIIVTFRDRAGPG